MIELANQEVSILVACQVVGMELRDEISEQRSSKVHCPFGHLYHSDGGVDAAMRIYPDTNSAWCFSCSYYYTPVKLVARAFDTDQRTAANLLLDRIGYRSPDPRDVWHDVVDQAVPPDRLLLAEALKIFCRRVDPQWSARQYEPRCAGVLRRCLGLLDQVHTDGDAEQWLAGCKIVMLRLLQDQPPIMHLAK